METSTFISILSLVTSIFIGVFQIKLSGNQKKLEIRLEKFETNIILSENTTNSRSISNNSNNGPISNNVL